MEIPWTIVGILVPVFIGTGFTVLGLSPPEFKIARACFWVSAIMLGGMNTVWDIKTDMPGWWRVMVGTLIWVLIGVGLPEGLRWVTRRQLAQATPKAVLAETPSVDLLFDSTPGREAFNFLNRGNTNLYLWGTKLGDGPRSMDIPRVITPGGSYHIWAQKNATEMRQKLGASAEARVNLEVYVSLGGERKYILTYQLWIRLSGGVLTIETQNLGFRNEDFTKAG